MVEVKILVLTEKSFVTRNTLMKYESSTCYGSKVMIKVKFLGEGRKVKHFATEGKVLSKGLHMLNNYGSPADMVTKL